MKLKINWKHVRLTIACAWWIGLLGFFACFLLFIFWQILCLMPSWIYIVAVICLIAGHFVAKYVKF